MVRKNFDPKMYSTKIPSYLTIPDEFEDMYAHMPSKILDHMAAWNQKWTSARELQGSGRSGYSL